MFVYICLCINIRRNSTTHSWMYRSLLHAVFVDFILDLNLCVCIFFSLLFYIHFIPDENWVFVYIVYMCYSFFSLLFFIIPSLLFHLCTQTSRLATCMWHVIESVCCCNSCCFLIRQKYGASSIKILYGKLNFNPSFFSLPFPLSL